MPKENKENNGPQFEGLNPPALFREFAAECMDLAQTAPTPKTNAVYENGKRLASNGAALGEKELAEARRIAANIAKLPELLRR